MNVCRKVMRMWSAAVSDIQRSLLTHVWLVVTVCKVTGWLKVD
jgi:hypothetical protein